MALSAFINLKWAGLIDKLRKRITIDANSVIRSTAPQTPLSAPWKKSPRRQTLGSKSALSRIQRTTPFELKTDRISQHYSMDWREFVKVR
jgi:hypothetical protein